MLAKDRIIVALDVDSPEKAIDLATQLEDHVGFFKIGLELIYALIASILVSDEGEAMKNACRVRQLFRLLGRQFFMDGKFHDIPNTVAAAARVVAQMIKVGMFNIHASNGVQSMIAAAANKGESRLLGVTVLTSHEENDANLIFGGPSKAKVLQFARDAKLAGCDGLICSPQELPLLNSKPELAGLMKYTPGIRSASDPPDDQKRTMSPYEAIMAGADGLVIGRPITKATSPVSAALKIAEEIRLALTHRLHLALFSLEKIKFGSFRLKLHETNPTAPLSPIYLNIRDLPEPVYALIGDILHDLAVAWGITDFDYVVGIPKAGEPIGKAFAKAIGKPHLRIEKVEGAGERRITSTILDPFEKGKKVVVVDDLCTKAHTKREAIESIEANGLEVVATLVLYDREQGGSEELCREGRKILNAARLSELLDFLVGQRKIDEAKKAEVLTYVTAN